MKRLVLAALLTASAILNSGCSSDGKKSDPRPADGSTPDPNVKPDVAGTGGVPGKTKENKTQDQPVKGD